MTQISNENSLALFDFDGTITKKDSFIEFIRFVHKDGKFIIGFLVLLPTLIRYKLRLIPNFIAKEKVLTYFFKDMPKDKFIKFATEYSLLQIDKITKKSALAKLKWHKSKAHKIIIVSASIDCYLRPWCEKNGFELLATKLEIKNDKITGKLHSKNCYGMEKVRRVKEKYDLSSFSHIYAYGDSKGDTQMLSLADESFYAIFKE